MSKPVEWTVRVPLERLVGYVDNDVWFEFLNDRSADVQRCYTKSRPSAENFSVLLPFPLFRCELLRKQVFNVMTPLKAPVVEDVNLATGG